ncbi:helix-turn-helix domain-containing protein [Streptosporangium saharense]|uniref:helix-turn-helix domain-containing protein n=1 Tax=Streptosporangium saharense TaxID=1706840 RepID=UPI00367B8C9B
MSVPSSSGAQQARQLIADRLREILRDSGLTARALAQQAGWDESKCSRLLHGKTAPSDDDIRTWCTIAGAPEEIPNLLAASRSAASAYMELRRHLRSLQRLNEMRTTLHTETRLYRFYSSNVVPWPLQSPAYMRALMVRSAELHQSTPPDIAEAVKARVKRQDLLNGARSAVLIIEQAVLLARPFGKDVMREQLARLLSGMQQPNVLVGIVPVVGPRAQKITESFHLYDDRQVFIEFLSASITITQPREIELYVRCFNDLRASAAYGSQARAMVQAALAALD